MTDFPVEVLGVYSHGPLISTQWLFPRGTEKTKKTIYFLFSGKCVIIFLSMYSFPLSNNTESFYQFLNSKYKHKWKNIKLRVRRKLTVQVSVNVPCSWAQESHQVRRTLRTNSMFRVPGVYQHECSRSAVWGFQAASCAVTRCDSELKCTTMKLVHTLSKYQSLKSFAQYLCSRNDFTIVLASFPDRYLSAFLQAPEVV